jgi:cyclase
LTPSILLPDSRFFQLESVADGVYAALIRPGTGALGNAAIVDLGDRTLVLDTFLTPQAAQDLRAAAEALTGNLVEYVVNSHFHADHVCGNQVFANATIIATEQTRALMERRMALLREQAGQYPLHLRELEESLVGESDPRRRAELEVDAGDIRELVDALPTLDPILPNLLFTERLVLRGSARVVELLSYGGGHTPSDAFLYLPAERVAIMGDLGGVANHMALRFGDPIEWMRILERVEALEIDVMVPGHGPVGTRADLATLRQYLADLQRLAAEALAGGMQPEQATTIAMPEQYQSWGFYTGFWQNLQLLMERLSQPKE